MPGPAGYVGLVLGGDWRVNAFAPGDPVVEAYENPLAELADGAAMQSASGVNLFADNFYAQQAMDYHVHVRLKTQGTGATTSDRGCHVYAISMDGSTGTWSENGSDAGGPITLTSPTNAIRLGFLSMPQNGVSYQTGPFTLAAAFGGIVPPNWAIVVENRTGAALSATEADLRVTVEGFRLGYYDANAWIAAGGG